jgi:hypothetical protein
MPGRAYRLVPIRQGDDTMATATLMTHCGAIQVTRAELATFVPPARTATWMPIKHSDLIDALHTALTQRGFQVRREQYAVQKQGALLFGTLDLDWYDTGKSAAAIGLRTANDKSMALQLAVGQRIFICDNLCFAGDLIALKRKHTAKLDLPRELAGALDHYEAGVHRLAAGIERLTQTPLTMEAAKVRLFDLFHQHILPLRLLHPVIQTLASTSTTDGWNAWMLHNACTTHIKALPPGPAFRATTRLGHVFGLN